MITIKEHLGFSEQGKRSNNEDCYGFIDGMIYLVCDGVGGAEKGEVASQIVVDTFLNEYKLNFSASAQNVVLKAEQNLSEYLENNEQANGMATTLAFLQKRAEGIYLAWVGDSRIYQFRNGKIIYKTRDHSWVNEAFDAGIITEEEAVNHPKSNIITRAIQSSLKPVKVDEVFLTNVCSGDFFLLCSDGVLEAWKDEDFVALFGQTNDIGEIKDVVIAECSNYSRDNYTSIVLQIEKGNQPLNFPFDSDLMIEAIPLESHEINNKLDIRFLRNIKKLFSKRIFYIFILSIICIAFACYYLTKPELDSPKISSKKKINTDKAGVQSSKVISTPQNSESGESNLKDTR
jgi:serine/threonine protein phosphatase PrpC